MLEWAAAGWKWQRASGGGSVIYLVYLYALLSRMQISVILYVYCAMSLQLC